VVESFAVNRCLGAGGKPRALLYLKLVLTAVFWGGTFVAGRIASREAGPFSAAFLRFFVASIFLLIFVLRSNGRTDPRVLFAPGKFFLLLLLGLTGVFAYNVFFFSGLKTVTASRASFIIAANPAFIALFSALLFNEKLGLVRAAGIFISFAGAAVVISKGSFAALLQGRLGGGELYILGCVASWVSYSLLGKKAMRNVSPLAAVTCSCVMGTVCLLAPALCEGLPSEIAALSSSVWLAILYLGFFGSALGFTWYYEGILALGPPRAGVFINIVPISSAILGFVLLHESIDISLALGAVLTLSGVFITNYKLRIR
jgi:drug/metabolite transporter (DMT)-like permease